MDKILTKALISQKNTHVEKEKSSERNEKGPRKELASLALV